jgi:hypothetical protein
MENCSRTMHVEHNSDTKETILLVCCAGPSYNVDMESTKVLWVSNVRHLSLPACKLTPPHTKD